MSAHKHIYLWAFAEDQAKPKVGRTKLYPQPTLTSLIDRETGKTKV